VAFSPDGAMMWTNESPLEFGIDANDDVVGLVGELGSDQAQLLVLDAAGEGLRTVLLPSGTFNATALALAADGTQVALLANEISSPGLTKSHVVVSAVDAKGSLRWSTPLDETLVYDPADLTTHYAVFVDAAGTVVVTAGNVTALDLASGAVLWTLVPAAPRQCLRPVVLGTNGSLVGTQCDGTVFLAR
jgi:outer membrane protein assembly factor BamB